MVRYLIDENLPSLYRVQLLRRVPDLVIREVGESDAPPLSTLDPEILRWCEDNDYHLVTGNRTSMPQHLADHLAAGGHVPGILELRPDASIGRILDDLILIAVASRVDEYQDRIEHVPLQERRLTGRSP